MILTEVSALNFNLNDFKFFNVQKLRGEHLYKKMFQILIQQAKKWLVWDLNKWVLWGHIKGVILCISCFDVAYILLYTRWNRLQMFCT